MATPRRRWLRITGTLALLLTIAGVSAIVALRRPYHSEWLRSKIVTYLSDQLDSEVEMESVVVTVLPRLRVEGNGLAIHHMGRRDVPPLISMNSFLVEGSILQAWRRHVGRVVVERLDIRIPPKEQRPSWKRDGGAPGAGRDFVVDQLIADAATLSIIPRESGKPPKVWRMHQLRLQQVGIHQKMPFQSVLTNAVPPGEIVTEGTFGPWGVQDPGQTPLSGTFTFDNADLGVFKGISGILSARGSYGGVLQTIDVHGETTTPDFTVRVSGHPVPLEAKYHAIVDGTNGNTTLERIDARFLNTSVVARGGVYGKPGVKGRTVSLDISMDNARIEDLMRLSVKADKAPMTGALFLQTKFELPPGDIDVVEKLRLDGQFRIGQGLFTDRTVQQKIVELSRRATVEREQSDRQVASDFAGRFKLANGTLSLPEVTFVVPGAAVELSGRYALQPEMIDFSGNLFMDAKISQTMTGWKSWMLKVVDPLFRRNGETVIPIQISGKRTAPSFGLDKGRIFKKDDVERPKTPAARKSK